MFNRVRIVLVATSHSGNIGACARAMKNMGLSQLVLVQPCCSHLNSEAIARASGADDILKAAQVIDSLPPALVDCQYVMGASARLRAIELPVVNPREGAVILREYGAKGDVAILFGRERTGLTNEELDCCQQLIQIPTEGQYFSLNLAMAVQVISYELLIAFQTPSKQPNQLREVASNDAMDGLFNHLNQTLIEIGFADKRHSDKLFRRFRRIFFRAEPDLAEVNLLRGFLSAAQGRKSMKK